jgi:hypothetical protein
MGSSRIIGYGFDFTGEYFESNAIWGAEDVYELATETEVFEALKNEAIKRGFKEGVKYRTGTNSTYIASGGLTLDVFDLDLRLRFNGGLIGLIFENGKWATIIKEPTIELNGEYTKVQLTDIINNRL